MGEECHASFPWPPPHRGAVLLPWEGIKGCAASPSHVKKEMPVAGPARVLRRSTEGEGRSCRLVLVNLLYYYGKVVGTWQDWY